MILVGAVAATPAAGAARRPRRANRATWRLPGRLARVVACNNNRLRDDRWAPRAPPRGRDADATRRRAAVNDASAPRRREDDEPADAPAVPAMDVVAPPRSVLADPDAFRAARAEASNADRMVESALDASSKTRGGAAAMRASAAVLLGGAALFAAAAALPLDVLPGGRASRRGRGDGDGERGDRDRRRGFGVVESSSSKAAVDVQRRVLQRVRLARPRAVSNGEDLRAASPGQDRVLLPARRPQGARRRRVV